MTMMSLKSNPLGSPRVCRHWLAGGAPILETPMLRNIFGKCSCGGALHTVGIISECEHCNKLSLSVFGASAIIGFLLWLTSVLTEHLIGG